MSVTAAATTVRTIAKYFMPYIIRRRDFGPIQLLGKARKLLIFRGFDGSG